MSTSRSQQLWWGYLFFVALMAAGRAYYFFSPKTPEFLYFYILCHFDMVFLIPYVLSCLQVIFNLFHCIPLALYIFNRQSGSASFWRIMFSLRIIFDFTGNAYAQKTLLAIYKTDHTAYFLTLLVVILPLLPWYWACWKYAFK